jgi:septal ring factor EnvC (AmiA/AmiB activator)
MAALVPSAVCRRALRAWLFPLALMWLLVAGCGPGGEDHSRQFEGLKADLDESKRRLSHLQNSLAAKDAELAVTTTALETAKSGLADMEKVLNDHNTQLRAVKIELDELKKRDALVFAEIAAAQQQGQSTIAVARYQKFIADFPKSPLVAHANTAIAQLTEVQREVRKQVEQLDPKRRERDFQKTFNEGYMTLQELAPYLKKKTVAQVLALLGRPNQTFNDGTEIGYADRAINPATSTRGMLIVSFEGGTVSTLRVEYAGRKMTP